MGEARAKVAAACGMQSASRCRLLKVATYSAASPEVYQDDAKVKPIGNFLSFCTLASTFYLASTYFLPSIYFLLEYLASTFYLASTLIFT